MIKLRKVSRNLQPPAMEVARSQSNATSHYPRESSVFQNEVVSLHTDYFFKSDMTVDIIVVFTLLRNFPFIYFFLLHGFYEHVV